VHRQRGKAGLIESNTPRVRVTRRSPTARRYTPAMNDRAKAHVPVDASRAMQVARDVLAIEARAIEALASRLSGAFVDAVSRVRDCRGRVVVCGIGKSGHVARKLAATLASTGTPAFFVHPAEANHGDLGMITPDDVVIMLSNSGETDELVTLAPHVRRQGASIIAMTGNEQSSLAQTADIHLDAAVDAEACPLGLAPTASTTAMLALGDALAIALLDARGFSADDFARSHPGGALGRRLLTTVRDVMRGGDELPTVTVQATLAQAVIEMSSKGMGMTAVLDADGRVAGVFTDGDLRRAVERGADFRATPVGEIMSSNPRRIGPERLAIDCVALMERTPKVTQLLVVDAADRLVGALHIHDLFRARVV
jgi:arabinose-5-phosphate isomerase